MSIASFMQYLSPNVFLPITNAFFAIRPILFPFGFSFLELGELFFFFGTEFNYNSVNEAETGFKLSTAIFFSWLKQFMTLDSFE